MRVTHKGRWYQSANTPRLSRDRHFLRQRQIAACATPMAGPARGFGDEVGARVGALSGQAAGLIANSVIMPEAR